MIQASTFNQLENVNNRYQGTAKRVLCVCSAGLLRSPTTAVVLQREFGYNTRSAGLYDYALIPVSRALIAWADQIVFMEDSHLQIFQDAVERQRIQTDSIDLVVLNIPDHFEYMDEELQRMILKSYKEACNADGQAV